MFVSYLYDMDPGAIGNLLAPDRLDVADGLLEDQGQRAVNPLSRTLIIALGGMGVKTINRIKGEMNRRFGAAWQNQVAFLAIDSDRCELEQAEHLTRAEWVCLTDPGMEKTVMIGEQAFCPAWRTVTDEQTARMLPPMNCDGAGQRRLMGKLKLYYNAPGKLGHDEEIVEKLKAIRAGLPPAMPGVEDSVYVIAGLAGGTGGGCFTEMPALIRRAMGASSYTLRGMFYLPDTMTAWDVQNGDAMQANGYAALKELNYYQGIEMRSGQKEVFPSNSSMFQETLLDADSGFYTVPYLIGTFNGGGAQSAELAVNTVTEFLVNSLVDTRDWNNNTVFPVYYTEADYRQGKGLKDRHPNNPEREAEGTLHEFPKGFASLGLASGVIPKEPVRAYIAGQICQRAGFLPVSEEKRAQMRATGAGMLPFMGEDQLLTAEEITQTGNEMLHDLVRFLGKYTEGGFVYTDVIGPPSWESIYHGDADDKSVRERIRAYVEKATDSRSNEELEHGVRRLFVTFRAMVQAYVRENGPMAFYNLYHGRSLVQDGRTARGIRQTLVMLIQDLNYETGQPLYHENHEKLLLRKEETGNEIRSQGNGLLDMLRTSMNGTRSRLVQEWEMAYNRSVNAEIALRRRELLLGEHGALKRCFLEPAQILCRQIFAFGKVLETMTESYLLHGRYMESYGAFRSWEDPTRVNIAAFDPCGYQLLRREADALVEQTDPRLVRHGMVDSFFREPEEWMEVNEGLIFPGNIVELRSKGIPVDARRCFDRWLKKNCALDPQITVHRLLTEILGQQSQPQSFVRHLLMMLGHKSAPPVNGNLATGPDSFGIVIPRSVWADPNMHMFILNQAQTLFPNGKLYFSDEEDRITIHRVAAPFEIYRLRDLESWERSYERLRSHMGNGLHGKSPDVKRFTDKNGNVRCEEQTTWFDYPAITYSPAPRKPDAQGSIPREIQVRNKQEREIIGRARDLGLLICRQEANGEYQVYTFLLDKVPRWEFEMEMLEPDSNGCFPMGEKLLEQIMYRNRVEPQTLMEPVRLIHGGLTGVAHTTEEWAWFYAWKTLFANRPLLYRIRECLGQVEQWQKTVDQMNQRMGLQMESAVIPELIQAGMLYRSATEYWCFRDKTCQGCVLIDPDGISDSGDRQMETAWEAGFHLYSLYRALKIRNVDLKESLEYAREILWESEDPDRLLENGEWASKMVREEFTLLKDCGERLMPGSEPISRLTWFGLAAKGIGDREFAQELVEFYRNLKTSG